MVTDRSLRSVKACLYFLHSMFFVKPSSPDLQYDGIASNRPIPELENPETDHAENEIY